MTVKDWEDVPLSLSAEQVGEIIGVSRSTVHRLIQADRLKAVRVSRRRTIISKAAVKEFLEGADSEILDEMIGRQVSPRIASRNNEAADRAWRPEA